MTRPLDRLMSLQGTVWASETVWTLVRGQLHDSATELPDSSGQETAWASVAV
jgi:hypothetical protein